jgi:hypothetical protein
LRDSEERNTLHNFIQLELRKLRAISYAQSASSKEEAKRLNENLSAKSKEGGAEDNVKS